MSTVGTRVELLGVMRPAFELILSMDRVMKAALKMMVVVRFGTTRELTFVWSCPICILRLNIHLISIGAFAADQRRIVLTF